jgi:hypothetical protein
MNYKQCKLNKGNKYQYSWIPEKFAKKGKILRILDENGWVVKEVYTIKSEKEVKGNERDWKKWRSVTDI